MMETIGENIFYEGSIYLVTPDFHRGVVGVAFKKKVKLDNGEDRYLFSDAFSSSPSFFDEFLTEEQVKRYVLPNKPIPVMEQWEEKEKENV